MEYLLKSTFILSLFYIFYILFLQRDTFFQSIRFYFISGILTSLLLPLITIHKYVFMEPVNYANISQITNEQLAIEPASVLSWNQIFIGIYIIGVLFFLLKFLSQLISLLWFLNKNPKSKEGKFTFISTKKEITPFSFFNYIVLNYNTFKTNELKQIIAHEKIHAGQLHSIDTLVIQVIAIFNWFNPFVWLFSREIQKNLEFIADDHAQSISSQHINYQHLLLKTVSPNYPMAFTSNFYNSLIKKRIHMLQKNRSSKTNQIKFLLMIPMLIAFVFIFNTKVIAQNQNTYTVKIGVDQVDFYETILKSYSKTDLENLKTRLALQDVSFKYKKLKYNSNNEITGISISVKDKNGNQSNFSQKSDQPIKTISIKISSKGALTVGNSSDIPNDNNVFFSPGSNKETKTIIVKNSGKGDKSTVWVSDDNATTTLSMGGDKKKSYTYTIKRVGGEDDIRVGHDLGSDSDKNIIFISDGIVKGDSTKLTTVKVIELDEDSGKHKVMIKTDESSDGTIFIMKTDGDKINASNNNDHHVFISNDNDKKPLFVLDGKEISAEKMEDLKPDNIKSMNVLKGEKATQKYGDKGKDGVIEITTKK